MLAYRVSTERVLRQRYFFIQSVFVLSVCSGELVMI